MASTPTFTPNPYANFDPSQWSNPYSNFQNSAIPFPATYSGWPTDASGNPIQPTPGMTLNSSAAQPAAPAAPAAGAAPNPFANGQIPQGQNTAVAQPRGGLNIADWQALSPAQRSAAMGPMAQYSAGLGMMPSGNNFVASGANPSGANPQASTALALMNAGGAGFNQMVGQPSAAAPATAANPAGLTPQQYLQLRANPGHVTTPGATVPQSPSSATPGPGMLQQFLANWNPATSGPGSGFQQAFSKALRGS